VNTWNTFPGAEIQKWEYSDNNKNNKAILQNVQSLNKQYANNVQYQISRDYHKMKLRGYSVKLRGLGKTA
jgi:hypothetical protein